MALVFRRALALAGDAPAQVTTDGHDAHPRVGRGTLGPGARHRTSRHQNNRPGREHRGVEQRHYPTRGFGSFAPAARRRTGFEEQRQYLRPRTRQGERVALAGQRLRSRERRAAVMAELVAA